MSRSKKKGRFVHPSILKKIKELNAKGEKNPIKTWSRASMIIPALIGHRLGEFSPTRRFGGHADKKSKTGEVK